MNKRNFQLVSIVVMALIAGLLLGNRIASRQLNNQQNSLGGLLNNLVAKSH